MIDKELLKYYLILREQKQPIGVREAQRILGFKSPGKSHRVLRKLVKLGLATRSEDGKYVIARDPPLELIGKVFVKGRLLPKIIVLTTYTTTLSTVYIILAKPSLEIIILLLLLNIPLWFESIIEYRYLKKKWFE
ncbi:MAG: hypothetical protein QXW87_03280 [Desulfurococcaceae archaeon]|uniref:LexA repressor DNA-binding domain-containing protein n=2 Tax=Staphylothermus marinus TaxID=2280 RepID=A0A7C4D7K2_STAMA